VKARRETSSKGASWRDRIPSGKLGVERRCSLSIIFQHRMSISSRRGQVGM